MQKRLVTLLQVPGAEPFSFNLSGITIDDKSNIIDRASKDYHELYPYIATAEDFRRTLSLIFDEIDSLKVGDDAALSNSMFSMTYGIREVQIISEEAFNKLEELIEEPVNPSPELVNLMTRERRYTLRDSREQKMLNVNISGTIGAGKTSAAAILHKFLKAAGVNVEMKSDDIKDLPSNITMVDLAGWLRDNGTKVVITDGKLLKAIDGDQGYAASLSEYPSNMPCAVLPKKVSVEQLVEMIKNTAYSKILEQVACDGCIYTDGISFKLAPVIQFLYRHSLISKMEGSDRVGYGLTELGQVVFDKVYPGF